MERCDIEEILQIIKENNLEFIVNDNGVEYKNDADRRYLNPIAMQILYISDTKVASLLKKLSDLSQIAAHKIFSWEKDKFDIYITHKYATKKIAAEELIRILKINSSEVIGIGDGSNDIPMLNACGLKVAMGNSFQTVKEIADYIAPSIDKDGVAAAIEKFVLEPSAFP